MGTGVSACEWWCAYTLANYNGFFYSLLIGFNFFQNTCFAILEYTLPHSLPNYRKYFMSKTHWYF